MLKICHVDPAAVKKNNPLKNPSENPRYEVDLMVWMPEACQHRISSSGAPCEDGVSLVRPRASAGLALPWRIWGFPVAGTAPCPFRCLSLGLLVCFGGAEVAPGSVPL